MGERVILDPAEVSGTRSELDISDWIRSLDSSEGPDWGDAQMEGYRAQATAGEQLVDFRIPNRQVKIPLMLKDIDATTFASIRSQIQAKVGLFQAEGGWIKRELPNGKVVFAEIVAAACKFSGSWMAAHRDFDNAAEMELECLPDWYEDWVTLDELSASGTGELIGVLEEDGSTANIRGDFPLGNRCALEVTGDASNDQLGLVGAFRSRHYSADATAALSFEAEDLTPLDSASVVALTGASGGNAVQHSNLGTDWTGVVGTTVDATSAEMTQTGQYKLVARASTTSSTPPDVRAVWDVGDLVSPSENPPVTIPAADNFYLLDLGTIRLDRVPVGDHRWQGQIQARGESGGENVCIDRIRLEPVSEWWARLTAPINVSPGLADYGARDEFNQGTGALTGKTAPVGGSWAGAGDADDFTIDTVNNVAQRTAVSDSFGVWNGRFATLGPNATEAVAQIDTAGPTAPSSYHGAVLRFSDINNFFVAYIVDAAGLESGRLRLTLQKRVGGTSTTVQSVVLPGSVVMADDRWITIRFAIFDDGAIYVWVFAQGSPAGDPALVVKDTSLPPSGQAGFLDFQTSATAQTRTYDNFKTWVPIADAVLFSGESASLRTDALLREDSTGVAYGPVSKPVGQHPRMPQSGSEGRPVELLLATSRGDFDQVPDSGLDDIGVTPKYRACYLTVPSA